ncbi:MAG: hypothetical protein ACE5I8_08715, partial [Thermodesulfobacteriota bacterium]
SLSQVCSSLYFSSSGYIPRLYSQILPPLLGYNRHSMRAATFRGDYLGHLHRFPVTTSAQESGRRKRFRLPYLNIQFRAVFLPPLQFTSPVLR